MLQDRAGQDQAELTTPLRPTSSSALGNTGAPPWWTASSTLLHPASNGAPGSRGAPPWWPASFTPLPQTSSSAPGGAPPWWPASSAALPPTSSSADDSRGPGHPKRGSLWCFFKGSPQNTQKFDRYQIPTVSQLRKAGIRVEVGDGNLTKRISDVNFDTCTYKGVLYLPAFEDYDETESLLRNLVTYEYVVEKKADLVSYVHLMGKLINTEEDVKLMIDSGVLKNNATGSNKQLAEMWATMLVGITVNLTEDYLKVFDKNWEHYDSWWNKFVEEYCALYCRRIWLVGGQILLAVSLTGAIIGVVYTLLKYYGQGN